MSEPASKKFVTFRDLHEASRQRTGPPAPVSPQAEDPPLAPDNQALLFPDAPATPLPFPDQAAPPTGPKRPGRTVSPVADFQKVPNSIVRQALPDGLFRGKSKQVWDYLWSISRGAINPTMTVRRSRKDIKEGAGLGSMVTVDAALTHLTNIGLLEIYLAVGSARGNEYAIFTLEELAERLQNKAHIANPPNKSSYTTLAQKLALGENIHTSIAPPATPLNSAITPDITIAYKDNEDTFARASGGGMEAPAKMLEALAQAVQELHGEILNTPQEADNWRKVGDLLAQELKQAVARTRGVTSLPAFFAEHLRRTFTAPPKPTPTPGKGQTPKKSAAKSKKTKKKTRRVPAPAKKPEPTLSQHSFAECLRYAEHLQTQGQGINNPGGLATTLHRSGLADTAISRFLAQESAPPSQPDDTAADGLAQMEATELTRQIALSQECLNSGTVSGLDELEEKYGRFIHPSDWQTIRAALQNP